MKTHPRLVVSISAIALIAAACGTATPTESPTVVPAIATPTVEPVATPTAASTDTAAPAPTRIPYPGPSIPPGTLTIQIAAIRTLKFDTSQLTAPADTPFVIAFDNQDTGDAHNVAIRLGADLIFNPLPAIVGPAKADYYLPEGLSADTYTFLCTVHPAMNGTLTIE